MAKYHTSIRTLPVYNFYEILNTGDLSFLFHDEKEEIDLTDVWRSIYDEYCRVAKVDNRHLKQIAKVEDLKLKYYKIANLLELTNDRFVEVRQAAKEALKQYNYLFRADKPFPEELERLKTQLRVLKTKISLEEDKLPKEDKREAVSLMKQVVSLENMFTGRTIDIYTMSVEKWLALMEIAKEKVKAQKQKNKR